ncbi:unnamed protein product [Linum tenue]|uniref:Uncharacterized protein n=1 Tax=Linum tenue TaxID=586396 RepID=A0AAV0P0F4_9ROSI|nr:unnamed protein product [Linum tenue]
MPSPSKSSSQYSTPSSSGRGNSAHSRIFHPASRFFWLILNLGGC